MVNREIFCVLSLALISDSFVLILARKLGVSPDFFLNGYSNFSGSYPKCVYHCVNFYDENLPEIFLIVFFFDF